MVFSSFPAYLDPPNWNQVSAAAAPAGGSGGRGEASQLLPGLAAQRVAEAAGMAAAGSTARPISMTERARLAKIIPQPEQPLKCPRCDSINTKFCYFNNYSLSQPRHFCKTCRRYWTRGGALRNVPVGGGCRRNKRNKSSSKSTAPTTTPTADRQAGASSSTTTAAGGGAIPAAGMPQPGQLPFLSSMHTLADYGGSNLGLNFTGLPTMDDTADHYQVGSSPSTVAGLEAQWRLPQIQQFPLLGGLEAAHQRSVQTISGGMYHFSGEGGNDVGTVSRVLHNKVSGSSLLTQLASVKMEDNPRGGLNLPRQYLGLRGNDHHYWSTDGGSNSSGGGWATADLSGFNSSSSGNIL